MVEATQPRFGGIIEFSTCGYIHDSGRHCRSIRDRRKFLHRIIRIHLVTFFTAHLLLVNEFKPRLEQMGPRHVEEFQFKLQTLLLQMQSSPLLRYNAA